MTVRARSHHAQAHELFILALMHQRMSYPLAIVRKRTSYPLAIVHIRLQQEHVSMTRSSGQAPEAYIASSDSDNNNNCNDDDKC
jgi:hypothetical protein